MGVWRRRSLASFSIGFSVFGALATLLVAVSAPGKAAELPALQGELRSGNILLADLSDSGRPTAATHEIPEGWSYVNLSWQAEVDAPAAAPGSALTSYLWKAGLQFGYLTPSGHLHELRGDTDGKWTHADLMEQPVNSEPAAPGSALTSYFWGGYKQIAYLTADGHVHEICRNPGQWWSHADLLQQAGVAGAPSAVAGSALSACVWRAYKQIVYLTADGHVQELSCDTTAKWTHSDLMQRPGIDAAPAIPGSPLATYLSGDDKQIDYLTADGHVHELRCDVNEKWTHVDVSQSAGAEAAAAVSGSSLAAAAWAGCRQIAYLTTDGHIQELGCDAAGKWTHADLMEQPGCDAAAAAPGSPLLAYVYGGCKQFAYISPDGHVHELSCGLCETWKHRDLMQEAGMNSDFAAKGSRLAFCVWGSLKQIAYLSESGQVHALGFRP